jgi:hypothetical protein
MSEDKIKKLLVAGEEVILCDSASIDYRQGKLVLTSKRLFFCGAKSTFNRDYVIKKEVELKDIAKVSGDITGGGLAYWAWLERALLISASMAAWDFNQAQAMSMTKVTNWVNSIKLELIKSEGDFGFCPFCGNKPRARGSRLF